MSPVNRGTAAAAGVLLSCALLALPVCNALFDCGCSWPWSGGLDHCNIRRAEAKHHCPWCAHGGLGMASFGAAAVAGAAVAWRGDRRSRLPENPGRAGGEKGRTGTGDLIVRVLAGIGVFLVISLVAGWLTALAAGYPHFLF